jgi:hypothetical protein
VEGTENTSSIPAECIRYWWHSNGSTAYAEAETFLITADHNPGLRPNARGWKKGLQRLVDETGLSIKVLYFPPGMRKWKGIDDRLVFHIRRERNEDPCTDFEVIVNVIDPLGAQKAVSSGNDPDTEYAQTRGLEKGMEKAPPLWSDCRQAWGFVLVPPIWPLH